MYHNVMIVVVPNNNNVTNNYILSIQHVVKKVVKFVRYVSLLSLKKKTANLAALN